jgi:hypothetical protein
VLEHYATLTFRKLSDEPTLCSSALSATFGRRSYGEADAVSNAIGYAQHRSRSHDAVIRVYDDAGNVIETHEHKAISKDDEVSRRA